MYMFMMFCGMGKRTPKTPKTHGFGQLFSASDRATGVVHPFLLQVTGRRKIWELTNHVVIQFEQWERIDELRSDMNQQYESI